MSAVERRPEIGWGRPAKADCSCRIRAAAPVVSDAETTRRHEHKTMEGFMSAFRNALLGFAALGAMAAPALADSPASYDGVLLFYPDTGRMVMGHVDKASMDVAMKHAKPLNGPIMIVMSGGTRQATGGLRYFPGGPFRRRGARVLTSFPRPSRWRAEHRTRRRVVFMRGVSPAAFVVELGRARAPP